MLDQSGGTALIGGMYLGFRVVSGYDNKGLLWGIATLTYGFAVFHAISVVVGVFTRSTIAAMLIARGAEQMTTAAVKSAEFVNQQSALGASADDQSVTKGSRGEPPVLIPGDHN